MILIGLAFIIVALAIFITVQYLNKPSKTMTVINKVSFVSPPALLQAVKTYKLRIEMWHRIEEKSKIDDHALDVPELSFNKSDHPDIYDYCFGIINDVLETNLISAEKKYSKAIVAPGPLSLPREIIQFSENNSGSRDHIYLHL